NGVALLYPEAPFAEEDKALAKATGHSTASDAAKAAVRAGAGELIIGHFSARYKRTDTLLEQAREIFPSTQLAEEGKTYSIPMKKE
ncbi:MAG: ribonuclease, partial [Alistipes sp.]|nr:ribonuclease [Alistipes sp.]